MTPKGFEVGAFEVNCDVCGVKYSVRFQHEIAGKHVCVMCYRYRHMVHALRYVEHMAAKDCEDVRETARVWVPQDPAHNPDGGVWRSDTFCVLDCTCDTCGARKVLKFIRRWHNARR